jgi:hypothetical protein
MGSMEAVMCEMRVRKVEILFQLPVTLTLDQMRKFHQLADEICKANCPEGWAFWPSGTGARPRMSKVDCTLLGLPESEADPAIANGQEPEFDEEVFQIHCAARAKYASEK